MAAGDGGADQHQAGGQQRTLAPPTKRTGPGSGATAKPRPFAGWCPVGAITPIGPTARSIVGASGQVFVVPIRMAYLLPAVRHIHVPGVSTATPVGQFNRRRCPCRPRCRGCPVAAASVVTTPAGVTLRIVSLDTSATYTLPAVPAQPPAWPRRNGPRPPCRPRCRGFPPWPARVITTPPRRHLAHGVIESVRHVRVALAVHRHAFWVERTARLPCRRRCPTSRQARQGGHHP